MMSCLSLCGSRIVDELAKVSDTAVILRVLFLFRAALLPCRNGRIGTFVVDAHVSERVAGVRDFPGDGLRRTI